LVSFASTRPRSRAASRIAVCPAFISLLGSAYIHLAWLAFASGPLWWATIISALYAVAVFRTV